MNLIGELMWNNNYQILWRDDEMPIEALIKEATDLPDEYINMAVTYIQFLQFQYEKKKGEKAKPKRILGTLSSKFNWIADDFDETPDCMAEYLG